MNKSLVAAATLLVSGFAFTGAALAESPMCGEVQDDTWLPPEAIQEKIETMGYTIENMGVSEGNCYELTGLNVQGQSVTTYLDPRTGDVLQEDIAE
jgi:hypothetical protein